MIKIYAKTFQVGWIKIAILVNCFLFICLLFVLGIRMLYGNMIYSEFYFFDRS